LKNVPTDCAETSVMNYHYLPSNSSEERSARVLRGGGLKSLIVVYLLIRR